MSCSKQVSMGLKWREYLLLSRNRNQELLDIGYRNINKVVRSLIGVGKLGMRTLHKRKDHELSCLIAVLGFRMYEAGEVSWDSQPPPKGNQSWTFIGGTDSEAEVPKLWPPDAKSQLIGKDPDAGKDWRKEEKGTKEDEIVWRYHQLNGREFEQTPGDGEGQGSLACCSP